MGRGGTAAATSSSATKRGCPLRQDRDQAQASPGDDGERPFAAGQERDQVHACRRRAACSLAHHGSVRQDRFDPRDLPAHRAVAKRVDPARVGGDHAADRRAAARREVNPERQACLGGGALDGFERHSRAGRHAATRSTSPIDASRVVDRTTASWGTAPATRPRVAALRHDRDAGRRARRSASPTSAADPGQRDRPPTEPARPVDLVPGEDDGVRYHGVLTERGTQRTRDVVGHPLSVRRRPGRKAGASWSVEGSGLSRDMPRRVLFSNDLAFAIRIPLVVRRP